MTTSESFDFHRHGLRALRSIVELSAKAIADSRDIDQATAMRWKKVAERYLGACDSPARQRSVLRACEELGHSLERLLMIDAHTCRIPGRGAAWKARHELCLMDAPYNSVKARARQLVAETAENRPVGKGLRATQTRQGTRSLTWRASEREISDLLFALDNDIIRSGGLGSRKRVQARGEAMSELLFGRGATGRGATGGSAAGCSATGSGATGGSATVDAEHFGERDMRPASCTSCPSDSSCGSQGSCGSDGGGGTTGRPVGGSGLVPVSDLHTMVIVALPDYAKILAGRGDEIIFALTDGTTMTGAEYLGRVVAGATSAVRHCGTCSRPDNVKYALFHPIQGGVNTYAARFANTKQRDLASAEHPVCAWPGCHVPSYLCEMHHLDAHANGGETKPANLVPLCSFHNGCNDDDPHAPPQRGRMERRSNGRVERRGPTGQWTSNEHAASQLGALRLVHDP